MNKGLINIILCLGLLTGCSTKNIYLDSTSINQEAQRLEYLSSKISKTYKIQKGETFKIIINDSTPNIIIQRDNNTTELIRYFDENSDGVSPPMYNGQPALALHKNLH